MRSYAAHGRSRGIDVEEAKARDGVVAVFTSEQLPDTRIPVRLFPKPYRSIPGMLRHRWSDLYGDIVAPRDDLCDFWYYEPGSVSAPVA